MNRVRRDVAMVALGRRQWRVFFTVLCMPVGSSLALRGKRRGLGYAAPLPPDPDDKRPRPIR